MTILNDIVAYKKHLLNDGYYHQILIAGGIDANKIKQIETLHLNHVGYDISSGIEANGMKDKNKMLAVIQQLKGVQENV